MGNRFKRMLCSKHSYTLNHKTPFENNIKIKKMIHRNVYSFV